MESVVLVHGLWMTGIEMMLLRRRLRRCGYRVHRFRYRTIRHDCTTNAAALADFIETLPGTTVHLVAHSLGGLVVRRLLAERPRGRVGRLVMLGTPNGGSRVARHLVRTPLARLLGASATVLCDPGAGFTLPTGVGTIAGTRSMGLGRLFIDLPKPNDGTVAVDEVQLPGVELLTLPVSHLGLVASREAARQSCHFLQHGHFAPADLS